MYSLSIRRSTGRGGARYAFLVAALALVGCGDAASQGVHPTKQVFADFESWPALAPADLTLANFQPFRAVYRRTYQGADGPRNDRVIITAERVAWGPTAAIMVQLVDTGNLEFDDTTPRAHTRIFAEEDFRMLHQISPAPGSQRDYLLINTEGATARATMVPDATGEGAVQQTDFATPQLGLPALWAVGSMSLESGSTLRFASAELPAASNILGARPFHVTGREAIDAGPLGSQQAWVVGYPLGMTNGRVMTNYVVDRPPYLLGKRAVDLETDEADAWSLELLEFTTFER